MGKINKTLIFTFAISIALATSGCSQSTSTNVSPPTSSGLSAKQACNQLDTRMDTYAGLLKMAIDTPDEATLVPVGETMVNEGNDILSLSIEDSKLKSLVDDVGRSQVNFGKQLMTAPVPDTAEWEKASGLANEVSNSYKALTPTCVAALQE
jgi:hypothetical protein